MLSSRTDIMYKFSALLRPPADNGTRIYSQLHSHGRLGPRQPSQRRGTPSSDPASRGRGQGAPAKPGAAKAYPGGAQRPIPLPHIVYTK